MVWLCLKARQMGDVGGSILLGDDPGDLLIETQYFFSIVFGKEISHHAQEPRSSVSIIPCCFSTTPNLDVHVLAGAF